MNSMLTNEPLTPAELDRLSEFLESDLTPPETLWLDELHGFLTAVLCLPELLMPSQWLPVIWDGAEPDFETEQQAQEIMELILRLYNEIAVTLMEQRPYTPMMAEETLDDGRTEFDAHGWCHGFVQGMQLAPAVWDDEAINDALLPMIILSEMIKGDPTIDTILQQPESSAALADAIPQAVSVIYNHFPLQRTGARPRRHPSAKVGRNEPCPCGSGKKYKLCCGIRLIH
jgi:uncharacterized protein